MNVKEYYGIGDKDTAGPKKVYVSIIAKEGGDEILLETMELRHRALHSPDGFNWGYGGSGPADLARSLLWDVLGFEPSAPLYQQFKEELVSRWPMREGVCWRITDVQVREWMDAAGAMKFLDALFPERTTTEAGETP